jgi:hypothetical protein
MVPGIGKNRIEGDLAGDTLITMLYITAVGIRGHKDLGPV